MTKSDSNRGIIQRQLASIDCNPDAGALPSLTGSDSHTTCQRTSSALHLNEDERANKKAYVAIRLFANELILERLARGQVHRRAPNRVIGRIQRDLRTVIFVTHPSPSKYDRAPTYRVGRVPVTELRRAAHNKDVLSRDLSMAPDANADIETTEQKPQNRSWALTSPNVVFAVSEKRIDTCCGIFCMGKPKPRTRAPVCTAIACRGPTVTLKLPSYAIRNLRTKTAYQPTVTTMNVFTYASPLQVPISGAPSKTLQYDPPGKPVEKVSLHSVSALLMATNPREPGCPAC